MTPTSGTGSATFTVTTVFQPGLTATQSAFQAGLAATQAGTITIALTGAGNTVGPINVTLNSIGGVQLATDDGNAASYVFVEEGNSVNDGQPHHMVVARTNGTIWISDNGVLRSSKTPDPSSFGTFSAALSVGSSSCGSVDRSRHRRRRCSRLATRRIDLLQGRERRTPNPRRPSTRCTRISRPTLIVIATNCKTRRGTTMTAKMLANCPDVSATS